MKRTFLPILQEVKSRPNLPSKIYLSKNTKTGISINVSIAETCSPTKLCMNSCYAMRGPIVFGNSQRRQVENTILFKHLEFAPQRELDRIVNALASEIFDSKQSWVRWNASGDLIEGSVRVINRLAELHPKIINWVISRKPEMIGRLLDHPSIRTTLSFDETTPEKVSKELKSFKSKFKKSGVKFSWIRTSKTQIVPEFIDIVFNEHIGRNSVEHKDEKTCEATIKENNHTNACDSCRRCFT